MESRVRITVYQAGQCDPRKCTALKLGRHGFVRIVNQIRFLPKRAAVLNPFSRIAFSPADKQRLEDFGLAALDCSWEQVGDTLRKHVRGTSRCLPILIADPQNRAIAAVHAGWRGTAKQIVMETVEAMSNHFGSRMEDLVIAIGPGIGLCCYEVGPSVARQFSSFFPEHGDPSEGVKIDLAESTIRQLRRNGGRTGQIDSSGLCSRCLADMFHSYRRDAEAAGRMVSTIGIR